MQSLPRNQGSDPRRSMTASYQWVSNKTLGIYIIPSLLPVTTLSLSYNWNTIEASTPSTTALLHLPSTLGAFEVKLPSECRIPSQPKPVKVPLPDRKHENIFDSCARLVALQYTWSALVRMARAFDIDNLPSKIRRQMML